MIDLQDALDRATGADPDLDARLAEAFAVPAAAFTGSVEHCKALLAAALPEWRLHLGYGASGVFPYAVLTAHGRRCEGDAPTVPLAILRAAILAKAKQSP